MLLRRLPARHRCKNSDTANMAKKPIEIGGLAFPTKGKAIEHFQAILHRYEFGMLIPEPDATELHWLLERHPESASKAGVGIAHFSIRSAMFGTRCFEVVRVNGETTDFSLKSCIDGKAPTALADALKALRSEVADDIRQRKWEFFRSSPLPGGKVLCAISGKELSLDEAHADHAPPNSFKSIAQRFITENTIDVSNNFVTASKDNQYYPALVDRNLAELWRQFYAKEAVIRIVARSGEADKS
jgi:hypothetical protein